MKGESGESERKAGKVGTTLAYTDYNNDKLDQGSDDELVEDGPHPLHHNVEKEYLSIF